MPPTANHAECHMLPCNIHHDGMSPVHLYFLPTSLSDNGSGSGSGSGNAKNADDECSGTSTISCSSYKYAAQFRGRGLLAKEPTDLDPSKGVEGHVVVIGSSSLSSLEVTSSFRSVYEWQHEHDVVLNKKDVANPSTVQHAMDWCHVARAAHDPIPLDDNDE